MQHIGSALKKLIKMKGLNAGLVQQKAIDVWEEVVGRAISQNTETVSVEKRVLTIKTRNATWRQELQLQKTNIIRKLNKKLNKNIIKDIRFL
tara:strand:- start:1646 stop:1921 length:276 start_codon:yes stop_codon:yes gene_type:complete